MQNKSNAELAVLAKSDQAALNFLFEKNIAFLHSRINHYFRLKKFGTSIQLLEYDDYVQLGYLALEKAVIAFKPESGLSFLTYYDKYIFQAAYYAGLRMHRGYKLAHGYKNVKNCEIDYKEVITYLSDSELDIADEAEYQVVPNAEVRRTIWSIVFSTLSPMNANIVFKRYYYGLTLEEIGKSYGIGKERVRMRIVRSLSTLSKDETLRIIAADFYGVKV